MSLLSLAQLGGRQHRQEWKSGVCQGKDTGSPRGEPVLWKNTQDHHGNHNICSACKFTSWSLKGVVGTLGTYPGRGLRITWESASPNSRHESSIKKACRSPTLITEANALRSTVLNDRNLSSTDCRGSKGSPLKAARTNGRTRWGRGLINLLAPLRNLMTKSCFPTNLPSTASWCAAIAATYTLRVEGDRLRSSPSCRKESTTVIVHLRGSSRWERWDSTSLDMGARGCPLSEKGDPSSEEFAKEGMLRGALVWGT